MTAETPFQIAFIAIFVSALSISGYFRRKARESGGAIPRAAEGSATVLLRLLFAAPLYLSILAYMVNPAWMAWASLALPVWLRGTAAVVGAGTIPLLIWVLKSLGRNVSETFLTKESHALVTHGPYRWVRHPLYSAASLAFFSLGVVAANAFIMGMAVVAITALALIVIPREEANLTRKFGDEYRAYRSRTGMLIPRLGSRE
jgi:protein-S-isoprenylcysteine O-methyltransferase Ste14